MWNVKFASGFVAVMLSWPVASAAITPPHSLERAAKGGIVLAASKSLAGAVFVDKDIDAKFEFRDAKRVYVTFGQNTSPGEYEIDGNKIIIRSIGAGMDDVLTLNGDSITGDGFNFKRQR